MSDKARRLLRRAEKIIGVELEPAPAHMQPRGILSGSPLEIAEWLAEARAFLAQPEPAAREAVLERELIKQRDHWRAALTAWKGNETIDIDYASALAMESDLTRFLAGTSPAAAALLAQGERLEEVLGREEGMRVLIATALNRHVDECLQCGESVSADGLCGWGRSLNDLSALAPGEKKDG